MVIHVRNAVHLAKLKLSTRFAITPHFPLPQAPGSCHPTLSARESNYCRYLLRGIILCPLYFTERNVLRVRPWRSLCLNVLPLEAEQCSAVWMHPLCWSVSGRGCFHTSAARCLLESLLALPAEGIQTPPCDPALGAAGLRWAPSSCIPCPCCSVDLCSVAASQRRC